MRFKHFTGRKTTWQWMLVGLAFSFVLVAGIVASWIVSILSDLPAIDYKDLTTSIPQTSYILDAEGQIIDEVDPSIFSENISIDQIPDHVKKAFLAVEDRSFYKHHGLDLRQLAVSALANAKSGGIERGGSTITQQLVKNVYLSSEQSLDRKIKEAYLALAMEKHLDKDAILEAYLNRVALGLGSQGIEAASRAYFSKHAQDLSIEEGALLAGIVKSPATYQPLKRIPTEENDGAKAVTTQMIGDRSYDLIENAKSLNRKNLVLQAMAQSGYLTKAEADTLCQSPIVFSPEEASPAFYSSYVADVVSDEAIAIVAKIEHLDKKTAEKRVREGGLTIQSTIVGDFQKKLDALYDDYPALIARGEGDGANFVDLAIDAENRILDEEGRILYYPYDDFFDEKGNMHLTSGFSKIDGGIELNGDYFSPSNGQLRLKNFYYIDEKNNLRTVTGANTVFQEQDLKNSDTLRITGALYKEYQNTINMTEEELILPAEMFLLPEKGSLQPQSAAIITDNTTGAIVALSGGNDLSDPARLRYNHLMSKRQPGTAIIPLTTYLAALQKGDTLASAYDDTPMRIDGDIWPVSKSFYGYDVLADSIAHTRLAISGKILNHYGFDPILKNLARFDLYRGYRADDTIKTPKEDANRHDFTYDAMAAGNFVDGIDLMDLTNAYARIASPLTSSNYTVQKITDRKGRVVYEHQKSMADKQPDQDILLRYALAQSPLARALRENGYDAFAVSGSNKYKADYFAVGATPRFTYGLWMGNDLQKLPLAGDRNLAESLYASLVAIPGDTSRWELPKNFEMHEVSDKTGLLASTYARRAHSTIVLPFLPNTAPTKETKNYTRKLICSVSGQLASTYCPYETITYQYGYVRPEGYDPKDFDGIIPKDYYTLPTSYCHIHTKEWYEQERQKVEEKNEEDETDNEQNSASSRH